MFRIVLSLSHLNCILPPGTPAPTVTWAKEGKPLRTSKRMIESADGEKYSLLIPKAMSSDSGEYTCTANNSGGSAFCMVIVTVEGQCRHKINFLLYLKSRIELVFR